MRLFRRSRKAEAVASETQALELAPKLEQAVVTLAVHAQQIDTRLERLEDRVGQLSSQNTLSASEINEILDVRVHSATVAAELAQLSDELHRELESLNSKMDELGDGGQRKANRMAELAKQIIDLSDSANQSPSEVVASGKLRSA